MRVKSVEKMMAVLPDRFDDDERRPRRDLAEYFHAVFLAVDETVPLGGIGWMAALDARAQAPDGRHDGFFRAALGRPAFLICGQAQITISNEDNRI